MAARYGATASKASFAPEATTVSLPALITLALPDTGAARNFTPCPASFSRISADSSREIEVLSTTIFGALPCDITPLGPNSTSLTSLPVDTIVSTGKDVKEVLFGPSGVMSQGKAPKIVVDSTSISLEESAEIREKLAGQGVKFLAAPVSGNAKVIKAGKLTVVASGAKDAFDAVAPYLAAIGRGVTYVGDGELARIAK